MALIDEKMKELQAEKWMGRARVLEAEKNALTKEKMGLEAANYAIVNHTMALHQALAQVNPEHPLLRVAIPQPIAKPAAESQPIAKPATESQPSKTPSK